MFHVSEAREEFAIFGHSSENDAVTSVYALELIESCSLQEKSYTFSTGGGKLVPASLRA